MKKFLLLIQMNIFFVHAQWQDVITQAPYHIQTIQVDDGKIPQPSNILSLGQTLFVSFDDLQADEKDYYYKIIRYDENWKPSSLQTSEYIDGFDSDIITGMEQSRGTLQSYTHYFFQIPNESTHILLSGNYILKILNNDDEIVFSRPFIIFQKQIDVGVQIKWPNDISVKNQKQMIDVFLYKGNYDISDPYNNLQIKIIQNNNWNTLKTLNVPSVYQGNKWIYHYPNHLIFDGINEFRAFETKDIRGMNYGIVKRELKDDLYDFYLYPDFFRDKYLFYKDNNGAYIIHSAQAEKKSVEADYVYAHFSFDGNLQNDEKIYVYGQFNDYMPQSYHQLKYNQETGYYEVSVLLKQGYYNYMYVIKKNEKNYYTLTEGNFAETENIYRVLVYYRSPGSRFYEVIGYGEANSLNIK